MSMQRIGVDKTNSRIVAITGGAAFLVVFFLIASISLFSTLTYQNRVINVKKQAVTQLKSNIKARDSLVQSYGVFADGQQNFIGGSSTGQGPQDGSSPKITLDALPSKYDFPALTASLEKVATDQQVSIASLAGVDDEVAQSDAQAAAAPTAQEMPFEVHIKGGYAAVQSTVQAFERSIRPIQIQKLKLLGDQREMTIELSAKTYYQPEKTFNIQTKVVK